MWGVLGYVFEFFKFVVVVMFDLRLLEDIFVDVVRVGWDMDINGVIVGGFLGVWDGVEVILLCW